MEPIEKDFMEFFRKIGTTYGLKDLPLAVIGVLYLEPDEIAMERIAEKTGYSLASISNTVKMLETAGMIQRRRRPKTKKVFFYMEKNLVALNINKLKAAIYNMVGPAKEILPELIGKYKGKKLDKKGRKKLAIIENYYKDLLKFEIILQKWVKDLEKY